MRVEHPTGKEYAKHLQSLSDYLELPVKENTEVKSIEKIEGIFHLETGNETLLSTNLIWAAGEFSNIQCKWF